MTRSGISREKARIGGLAVGAGHHFVAAALEPALKDGEDLRAIVHDHHADGPAVGRSCHGSISSPPPCYEPPAVR